MCSAFHSVACRWRHIPFIAFSCYNVRGNVKHIRTTYDFSVAGSLWSMIDHRYW